mmetsp:Transcript_13901/g.25155  ORF Transcript_13901/g.25155 Transcript_13901/m.25155 type:complete len:88 (-) Transcript_13901:336-599(-)
MEGIVLDQMGYGGITAGFWVMKGAKASSLVKTNAPSIRVHIRAPASLGKSQEGKGKIRRCRTIHPQQLTHATHDRRERDSPKSKHTA